MEEHRPKKLFDQVRDAILCWPKIMSAGRIASHHE